MATILIVEDDIDTNEALSEYLGEAGHQTISAYAAGRQRKTAGKPGRREEYKGERT